jgi:hypothetical protein
LFASLFIRRLSAKFNSLFLQVSFNVMPMVKESAKRIYPILALEFRRYLRQTVQSVGESPSSGEPGVRLLPLDRLDGLSHKEFQNPTILFDVRCLYY